MLTNDRTPPALSLIIPARNEQRILARTIAAVRGALPPDSYEVIVVDNGSTDATAEVARAGGCRVLAAAGTIGAARNAGARAATGKHLVFLDADVVVSASWGERIAAVLAGLERDPRTLRGGMCAVPADASWIERVWFAPRDAAAFSHIGSGHLVTTRSFFEELGGFDAALETGEDYDLSMRAVEAGGRILPAPELVAEHHGFPRDLRSFMAREAWHGRSDFTSLRAVLRSRVALAALLWGGAHLALLAGMIAGSVALVIGAALVIAALCAGSAWHKYRRQPLRVRLANTLLFYVYFAARFGAAVRVLLRRPPGRSRG